MNKCYKCGQEFEGDFCPKCGTKHEQTKFCPDCGTELDVSVNFCNKCGHRFDTYENAVTAQRTTKPSYEFGEKFYKNIYSILKRLPCVLLLLFAVLNFVFMSCSAYGAFGFDMGNVFELASGDYPQAATALIVFCSVTLAYSLVFPLVKNKKHKLAHIILFGMYIAMLIVSCILNVQIQQDGWTVGVSTKLLIAFAVIFGVFSILSIFADFRLTKSNTKYAEIKSTASNKSQPSFMGKLVHNAKEWYKSHKKAVRGVMVTACSVAIVCVLIFAVIVPSVTNIFTEKKISKINLGDSKEQVINILGKPYGEDTQSNVWNYYGSEILNLYKQQDDLDKKMKNITDFSQLAKLMEQQEALDEKISKVVYRYIAVTFDSNKQVSSVTYDANCSRANTTDTKKVKNITIGNNNNVDVLDIANNTVQVNVSYEDGSYSLSKLPASMQMSNFGRVRNIFPSSATISWRDSLGEYSQRVTFDESSYNLDWKWSMTNDGYQLYVNGTIPTKRLMNLFDVDLPWKVYYITDIKFGKDVEVIPNLADIVDDATQISSITIDTANTNFYAISNIVFDKNGDIVLTINNQHAMKDDNGNVFLKDETGVLTLAVAASKGEELVLPYYNEGNYVISPDVSNKYKIVSFEQSELWTSIPENFLQNATFQGIALPQNIVSIGASAFSGCSSLTSITIPDGVTTIDWSAFYDCWNLSSIVVKPNNPVYHSAGNCLIETASKTLVAGCRSSVIPKDGTVTSIGFGAFYGCGSLTSITIPDSVTSIGFGAFFDCSSLTSVTIGNGVTSIGDWAFFNCSSLTSVTIGNGVTAIHNYAFWNCSSLTEIKFNGTVKQWNAIEKGDYRNYNVPATKVICSDGEVDL